MSSPTKTAPKKATAEKEKAPITTVYWSDPEDPLLLSVYEKLRSEGVKAERNPTAQLRWVAKQWAETVQ